MAVKWGNAPHVWTVASGKGSNQQPWRYSLQEGAWRIGGEAMQNLVEPLAFNDIDSTKRLTNGSDLRHDRDMHEG